MRSLRFVAFLILFNSVLKGGFTQELNSKPFDGAVSEPALAALKDQPMVLVLRSGLILTDTTFGGLIPDPRTRTAKLVDYQRGRRSTKTKVEDIYRMSIAGRPFYFRYHGPTRSYHMIDETLADEKVDERLAGLGKKRIEPTPVASLKEQNDEHRVFAADAIEKLGNPQLRIEENDFAILITDFSQPQTKLFSQLVPDVFLALNRTFGLPPTHTVLPGKAVIAFFSSRDNFAAFETKVMNNPNFGTSTSMSHYSSSRFVGVTTAATFDVGSIRSVCWSLASGYADRLHSNVDLPRWLASGLPSAIADIALPRDATATRREVEQIAAQLRKQGSLNGILIANDLDLERKSLAKLLAQFFIKRDPMAASQFIFDVKTGQEPWPAMATNCGLTPETFAMEFGQALGIANLKP